MRPFAVIDSETDPFKKGRIPSPFIWGYYDGKEFRHYHHDTLKSLVEFLSDQKLIVYAHNGGKFDYHFMLDYMEAYDSIKIINGRIASFYIGKCEFRDSYNILPVPLSKLAAKDNSGNVVEKQSFDYSLMERDERYKPEIWEKIVDYLRDDCISLYNAISAFQSEYGRHLTQAGAAMAQWKKISSTQIPKSSPGFFDKFKAFYFGGRVQCFRIGVIESNFSVYDINSAYPYAMKSESHPYGLDYIQIDHGGTNHENVDISGPAFYTVRAMSTGAFPYRTKSGLSFPADGLEREFNCTGWEILSAISTHTAECLRIFDEFRFIELQTFSEYIEHFYAKRLEAKAAKDSARDLFAKLLMNSLYGKFGANPENYANYMVLPPSEMDGLGEPDNEFGIAGELGPWILAEKSLEADEMRYYNVATAASITGFVRAYLWKAICGTGLDNILYCDTDSIATKSEGNELNTGAALGQWKHEGDFDKAGIGGKKMYIFRGVKDRKGKRIYKTASKGVKLTHNQLWQVASGHVVTHEPENPTFSVHSPPRFVSRRISLTR